MTGENWTSEDIAALPAWTLVQAYHPVSRQFYEIFAAEDLTPTQFGVLAELSANPGVSQAELARSILVRQQSMAALLSELIDRELLIRDTANRRGRSIPLHLSDSGTAALRRAEATVLRFNSAETLGLTESEAVVLNELLHKVIASSKHW